MTERRSQVNDASICSSGDEESKSPAGSQQATHGPSSFNGDLPEQNMAHKPHNINSSSPIDANDVSDGDTMRVMPVNDVVAAGGNTPNSSDGFETSRQHHYDDNKQDSSPVGNSPVDDKDTVYMNEKPKPRKTNGIGTDGGIRPTAVVLNSHIISMEPYGKCLCNCYPDGFQVYAIDTSNAVQTKQLASIKTPYAITRVAAFPSNKQLESSLGIEALRRMSAEANKEVVNEAVHRLTSHQPLLLVAACPPEGNNESHGESEGKAKKHSKRKHEPAGRHTFRGTDVRVFSVKENKFINRIRFQEPVRDIISSEHSPFLLVVLRSQVYVFNAFTMSCTFNLPIFPGSGAFGHAVSMNSRWMAVPASSYSLDAICANGSSVEEDYTSKQAHGATKNIVSGLQSLRSSGRKYVKDAAPTLQNGVQDAANIASNMVSLAAGAVVDLTTSVGEYMRWNTASSSNETGPAPSAAQYLQSAAEVSSARNVESEHKHSNGGQQQRAFSSRSSRNGLSEKSVDEQHSEENTSSPGFVLIMDMLTHSTVCLFRAHSTRIAELKFNGDGSLLATANERGQAVKIFRLTWPRQTVMNNEVALVRGGKYRSQSDPFGSRRRSFEQGGGYGVSSALSGNVDRSSEVKMSRHDVSLLYILERGLTSVKILDIGFSPDSKLLIAASSHGTCHCYRIEPCGGSPAAPMWFPTREQLNSALATADKVNGVSRPSQNSMDERVSWLLQSASNRVESLSSSRISHRDSDLRVRLDLEGWKSEEKKRRRQRERIQRCLVEQELAKRDAMYERSIKSDSDHDLPSSFHPISDMEPFLRVNSTFNNSGADVRPRSLWHQDDKADDAADGVLHLDLDLLFEGLEVPSNLPSWASETEDSSLSQLQERYNSIEAALRKYTLLVAGPGGLLHVCTVKVSTELSKKAMQNAMALLHPYFDNSPSDVLDLSRSTSEASQIGPAKPATAADLISRFGAAKDSETYKDISSLYESKPEQKTVDIESVSLRASSNRGRSLSENLNRSSQLHKTASNDAWYSLFSQYLGNALSSASRFTNFFERENECASMEEASEPHTYEGFPQPLPHGIAVLLNVLRDSDCNVNMIESSKAKVDLRRVIGEADKYFEVPACSPQSHRHAVSVPPRSSTDAPLFDVIDDSCIREAGESETDEITLLTMSKCSPERTEEQGNDGQQGTVSATSASTRVSVHVAGNLSPVSDGIGSLYSISEEAPVEMGPARLKREVGNNWEDSYETAYTIDATSNQDRPNFEVSSTSSPVASRDSPTDRTISPATTGSERVPSRTAFHDDLEKSDPEFFSATSDSVRNSFNSSSVLESTTNNAFPSSASETGTAEQPAEPAAKQDKEDDVSSQNGSQSSKKSKKKKSKGKKKKR